MRELVVGRIAHGGFCVARDSGRVIFVRHALPGERVRAQITDDAHDRYWRADAVEILEPSPDRVVPPCPHAGPGACGGCDWQHASLEAQRRGKAEVVVEALRRFGGLADPGPVVVEAVSVAAAGRPDGAELQGAELQGAGLQGVGPEGAELEGTQPDGHGWRTRMRFAVTANGQAGLRRSRSRAVLATPDCRIAHPLVTGALAGRSFPGGVVVEVAASPASGEVAVAVHADGDPAARASGAPGRARQMAEAGEAAEVVEAGQVVEVVRRRRFTVGPGVFWQVHPGAPEVLVEAVLAGLRPQAGETALDLYAGAGLFAAFLADQVGASGRVVAMESDAAAVAAAAGNLADLPQVSLRPVRVTPASVRGVLGTGPSAGRVDCAVLDPPRAGAGAEVVGALLGHHPRAVAYVACDPVALGRDLATAQACGYEMTSLRAFDLFPMTHHVECVAILAPRVR
ncbi:class I SAM-dependent RNA methyltransferase [Frankia sp. AiPa1]|uniref:class I SAM-dependent RNA methyltransferase n=1 Tax=Frankia sp. AiPa1 TaxID=573492 RepID=UPI00202B01F4|nr:TRAM domain-containing protein [Frankia sp. AiPa1]MCL9758068.1 TRAM domain-containing protein [Frankia sp. AiPa1]